MDHAFKVAIQIYLVTVSSNLILLFLTRNLIREGIFIEKYQRLKIAFKTNMLNLIPVINILLTLLIFAEIVYTIKQRNYLFKCCSCDKYFRTFQDDTDYKYSKFLNTYLESENEAFLEQIKGSDVYCPHCKNYLKNEENRRSSNYYKLDNKYKDHNIVNTIKVSPIQAIKLRIKEGKDVIKFEKNIQKYRNSKLEKEKQYKNDQKQIKLKLEIDEINNKQKS